MLEDEAYAYLEGVNGKNIHQGLVALSALMDNLNWPDQKLKIIHITGTNGKGSTSEFISQMLQAGGYKVGTFNTPYIEDVSECVRINGKPIQVLMQYMNRLESLLLQLEAKGLLPSGFEILTALALLYFADEKVDFVILEVGLGGRLDATNVIKTSLVSVFTEIGVDHKNILGDTLEAITCEKAGIIKPHQWVVSAPQKPEVAKLLQLQAEKLESHFEMLDIEEVTEIQIDERHTQFTMHENTYAISMLGKHQAYNAALALKVIGLLNDEGIIQLTEEHIRYGLHQMKWTGRFECISTSPVIYIDGAHNVDAAEALKETILALPKQATIGVIGMLRDKEVAAILKIMQPCFDAIFVTKPTHSRSLDENCLRLEAEKYFDKVYSTPQVAEAVQGALKMANHAVIPSRIICFGSLYMISDLKRAVKDLKEYC